MVSFVNSARIASLCVGSHLGTLHGYVFHQDFWPNLNFQLEYQIKLVLNWTKRQIEANSDCPEHNGTDINRPVCIQVGILIPFQKLQR